MLFSKNAFFSLLFLVLFLPITLPNLVWLLRSRATVGVVEGIGAASGNSLGSDTYALVRFQTAAGQTIFFQGKDEHYKRGDSVRLRYPPHQPEEARVATFWSLWGNTIAYCGVPLIFWVICFFAPDMVPKGYGVRVGGRPFLRLVPHSTLQSHR